MPLRLKVISLGYNKLCNYSAITHRFLVLRSTHLSEWQNQLKLREMKRLAFWKYSRKSSSLESKNFVDESGLIKSKLNIIKKEQYHLQCYSFTKNKTFLGEHTNHDHKLYITETALRRLLNGKFNNGIQFIQSLFYFDSQFIPQQNFQNHELLKIWEQFKNVIISNISLPLILVTGLIWDLNPAATKFDRLNFSKIDESEDSNSIQGLKRKSKDKVNNESEYKLKPTHHASILVKFIAKLLRTDPKNIKQEIYKHPKRLFVPTKNIEDTYMYLKEKGYGIEAIKDCPTVLFYPKEYVEKTLKFLELQHFKEENTYNTHTDLKRRLHLCVYYMEKPFYFSGEGIFPPDDAEKM